MKKVERFGSWWLEVQGVVPPPKPLMYNMIVQYDPQHTSSLTRYISEEGLGGERLVIIAVISSVALVTITHRVLQST